MNCKIDDLITFVTIARTGSFKAAAKQLGKDASVISRRIAQLEKQLGVKLLVRTTRSLQLTEAGNLYYNRLAVALDEIDSATRDVGSFIATPQGILRISLPVIFGRKIIAPLFDYILTHYPKIKIEAHYEDRHVDIVSEGFDVVIRIGTLQNSSLISRKIGVFRSLFVASPTYLSKYGVPNIPQDLSAHHCLGFTKLPSWPLWGITSNNKQEIIQPNCILEADDSEAIVVSALQGIGIALTPDWIANSYLKDGSLINILPEWRSIHSMEVHALMPPGGLIPAKTRVFIDHLCNTFSNGNFQQE